MKYSVYMIINSAGKLYIDITENPEQRLYEHNTRRGAKFTKYIPTYKIVFLEERPAILDARKREIQLKKWRREKKEILILKYKKGMG